MKNEMLTVLIGKKEYKYLYARDGASSGLIGVDTRHEMKRQPSVFSYEKGTGRVQRFHPEH